jgi:hypothetical protein
LSELAQFEKSLWDAFKKSEKDFLPPTLNPVKSWSAVSALISEQLLELRYHYPFYLAVSVLSALLAAFFSYWFLIPYSAFFWFAMRSRARFVEAYAKKMLGHSEFETFAFGIGQPSLIVAGMVQLRETGQGQLTQDAVQSILKILKASTDFSDISIGIADALKKFLFSLPFILAAWIFSNTDTFNKYATAVHDVAVKNWPVALFLAFIVLAVLFIAYDLVLGQTLSRRRRKKYVLALTLIAESFAKK